MANKYDQLRSILSVFAARFENNLIVAKAVSWKKYDRYFDAKNRFNVSEQVPPRYVVQRTEDVVADLSGGKQDTIFGSELVQCKTLHNINFYEQDFEGIRDLDSARRSERLQSAAENAAEQTDSFILRAAVELGNNWVGTPGNDIDDLTDFMQGYVRLKDEGVADRDLLGVLSYQDQVKLQKYIVELHATDAMSTRAFAQLDIPKLGKIPVMFTQQLPVFTTGTRAASGAALVNGGAQGSDYRDVSVATAQGHYCTQTIAVDGLTAAHTIKDGEVFTIAGVNAYDNRKQASLGRLQQFRVIGDHTADGGGAIAALRIFPAIIVPVPGQYTGDDAVNTAHATVTAVPADNAPITFVGTASTDYLQRAIIQKSALTVATANLRTLPSGDTRYQRLNSVPLSMRLHRYSDGDTGETTTRIDWVATPNTMSRPRAVRVNGQ